MVNVELKNKIKDMHLKLDADVETVGILTMEELAELQQAISKYLRNFKNVDYSTIMSDKCIEEIADVLIMVERIKIELGISDKLVENAIEYKINRTYKRYLNK